MPDAGASIAAFATWLGSNAIGAVVTRFAITVALSASVAAYNRRRADAAYRASLEDRKLVLRSATTPRRYALGRVRLGGVLAYADTDGLQNKLFDQLLLLCDGPIDSVEGVWFGEELTRTADFVGDAPGTGKYATTNQQIVSLSQTVTVTNAATFNLSRPPRSSAAQDITVTRLGTPGNPPQTLAVSGVSGNTVTLATAITGTATLHVDYRSVDGSSPMRVQFLLGALDQPFQNWGSTGVGATTPLFTGDMRFFGIATMRTLMYWDKRLYANGPPQCNALVRGIVCYDHRRNRCPNPGFEGGEAGTPGTMPTSHELGADANGLTSRVLGLGMSGGLPYLDVRVSGTATASGTFVVRLPAATAAPAAASGQAWNTRVYVKRQSGSLNTQFVAASLALVSYSSTGAATVITSTPLADADTGLSVDLRTCAHTALGTMPTGAVGAGAHIRLQYAAGQAIALTLRIALPQLWRTSDPTAYTTNPAVLATWFSLLPRVEGGLGRPWDYLDWDWATDSANICDELISVRRLDGTGYENVRRYECHTVLTLDVAPLDNFNVILGTMDGSCAFTAGRYRIAAGAYRAPTLTLTDADVCLDEPITVDPAVTGLDVLPNQVTATIVDRAKNYVATSVPPVVNSAYVAADGLDEPISLQLSASSDSRQANYLMGVLLERQRGGRVCSLTVLGQGANIALMQTLQLDLLGYEHLAGLTWEVRKRANSFNGRYALQLHEVAPTTWALDADRFTPVDPPDPQDLSYLWDVTPPQNFLAEDQPATLLPDGTTAIRIVCTWTTHPQSYVRQSGRIEIRYKRVDQAGWTGHTPTEVDDLRTVITVAALDGMRYTVQARATNGIGAYSEWVSDWVDIGATDALGTIVAKLTNETTTVPADSSGVVTSYAGASTAMIVERNNAVETGAWTISRTNGPGVTTTLASATVTLTALATGTDSSYVDITAARAGYPTQTKRWNISKNRGAVAPAGVVSNLSMSAEDIALDPDNAAAGVSINRDGSISVRNTVTAGVYATSARRWTTETGATVGDGYYVRFTQIAGDSPTLGTLGTWQRINADRLIQLSETIANAVSQGTYGIAIATAPGGDSLGSGTINLTAAVEVP